MKDRIQQVTTLALWIAAVVLWVLKGWWYIAAVLGALHLVEVFLKGVSVGKRAGKSVFHSVIMTLIFGYTWWLPLKKELDK